MDKIVAIIKESYGSMSGFIETMGPKVVAAGIVAIVGLLVARIAKAGLHKVLEVIGFERIADRLGLTSALERANVEECASDVICKVTYWTGLVFTLLATLGTLGIAATPAMTRVISTIPQVVLAGVILIFGLNVSAFVSKLVQTACVNAEISQARLVRNAMHYGLSTLVVLLAVEQFGISSQFMGQAFLIFFGATCLGLALAFGLGSRDLAGNVAKTMWQSENESSRALSDASELGHHVFPNNSGRKGRGRVAA